MTRRKRRRTWCGEIYWTSEHKETEHIEIARQLKVENTMPRGGLTDRKPAHSAAQGEKKEEGSLEKWDEVQAGT